MPRYDYKCKECDKVFEVTHGVNDNVEKCKFCGGEVRRVFHPVGIVFKGSGFYVTDSKADTKGLSPTKEPKPEDYKEYESGSRDKDNGKGEKKKPKEQSVKAGS